MKLPPILEARLETAQISALEAFSGLLERFAVPQGLVAAGDAGRVDERHVIDSLRAAVLFEEEDHRAVDIGSGGGLPGIPLAIALPACEFVLVESRSRRVGFLELAVQQLGLGNARALHARAEELERNFDVVTARAFAPIARTWATAHPLLRDGGKLIYFAGERLDDPAEEARAATSPAPPTRVRVDPVLESATPLVMMVRG